MSKRLSEATVSKAVMIDFLIANRFTESGGLVDNFSCATYEGFLCLACELEAAVF